MLVDAVGGLGDLNPRQVGSEELHGVFGNRRTLDGESSTERKRERIVYVFFKKRIVCVCVKY